MTSKARIIDKFISIVVGATFGLVATLFILSVVYA